MVNRNQSGLLQLADGTKGGVSVALWFEAGCRRSKDVPLRQELIRQFGFHGDTALRAIRELEKAGLVAIHHLPGALLHITLLDGPVVRTDEPLTNVGPPQCKRH